MKIIAFIIDLIVLGGLIFGMYALMGETYSQGGILTKTLLMGIVGGIYGLLRAIYRKWIFPDENKEQQDN